MSRSSSFLLALKTRIFNPTPVSLLSIRYFKPRHEPSSFWNCGMVHDFVQLQREQVIDLRDARIDHHFRVFGDGHRAIEHLGDKFFHQVLAALTGRGFFAEPPLLDDLIQQAVFLESQPRAADPC